VGYGGRVRWAVLGKRLGRILKGGLGSKWI
jgi:hypothetical protein